jgi:hypothetical protein
LARTGENPEKVAGGTMTNQLEERNRILSAELKAAYDNLTATQARCTALVEEKRLLESALKVVATEAWGALHPGTNPDGAQVCIDGTQRILDTCRKAGFDPETL